MGVTGLLQHLKEIQDSTSLSKYKGKTLAVDTYGWLHRGLISCAQELCQDVPTKKYVNSVMKKVDMLRHFGVEPYLVFDGAYLPTKAETAKERKVKRDEAQKKANELIKSGNRKLAWKEFMKAAGVTPQMAKSIMVELDQRKVKYIVAPYEADPQMVYLEKIGLVDGILSEDSDLLIFGCNRLITKLNDFGECIEICRENFSKVKKIPYLSNYTPEQLRLVAMLSGCDYTKGIPGVGLKTAFNLVKRYNNLEKVLAALRSEGKKTPIDFDDEVNKADLAFQFQKVFNPHAQKLETLNAYPDGLKLDLDILESCCGRTLSDEIHTRICNGHIHPNTLETLISREQSLTSLKSNSVNLGSQRDSYTSTATIGRSRSTTIPTKPKIGSIDSFFGSAKKIEIQSITPSTTNRKRTQITKEQVSPTTRKMTRIANSGIVNDSDTFVSPNAKVSKFFDNGNKTPLTICLPTPTSHKQPVWDSSMISGDSDIPDEFSSPFNHVRDLSVGKKIPNTENIIDSLTDNDTSDSEIKDFERIPGMSSSATRKSTGDSTCDFGIDEKDDEIEESPVKSKPTSNDKILGFAKYLRENYLMNSTLIDKNNNLINNKARRPLTKKDLNVDLKFDSKGEELKKISAEQLDIGLKLPENDTLGLQSNRLGVEAEQLQIKALAIKIAGNNSVSLQKFAFRG